MEPNRSSVATVYWGLGLALLVVGLVVLGLWLGNDDDEWFEEGESKLLDISHQLVSRSEAGDELSLDLKSLSDTTWNVSSLNGKYYTSAHYRITELKGGAEGEPLTYVIEVGDWDAATPPYLRLRGFGRDVEIEFYSHQQLKKRVEKRLLE